MTALGSCEEGGIDGLLEASPEKHNHYSHLLGLSGDVVSWGEKHGIRESRALCLYSARCGSRPTIGDL